MQTNFSERGWICSSKLMQVFAGSSKKLSGRKKPKAALTLPGHLGDKHLYWLASFIYILMELYILTTKLGKLFAVLLTRQYGWSTLSLFQVLQPCRPLLHLRLSILFFFMYYAIENILSLRSKYQA